MSISIFSSAIKNKNFSKKKKKDCIKYTKCMNLLKRIKTITSTHVGMSKFNQAVNTGKLFIKQKLPKPLCIIFLDNR